MLTAITSLTHADSLILLGNLQALLPESVSDQRRLMIVKYILLIRDTVENTLNFLQENRLRRLSTDLTDVYLTQEEVKLISKMSMLVYFHTDDFGTLLQKLKSGISQRVAVITSPQDHIHH